jgi:dynein heavy chain
MVSRMKSLQEVLKNVIQSSIDLNHKMRSIYLEKSQRLHYIFTLRVLSSLFRHMCVSLAPDCTKEQLLLLWHHECDWLYGHRMIDQVDIERYQLAYKTVIKMNFNDMHELEPLNKSVYFSNLKETESNIVIAGLNNANSSLMNSNNTGATSDASTSTSTRNSSTNSSNQNVFNIDGYEPTNDINQLRRLIQTAIIEFNKEQQRISLPLYETTINLICRLCHTTQCGNCCIIADGGLSHFVLQLVASLMQFSITSFKTSRFMYNKQMVFQQLRHKLIQAYYRAGIKNEKVMICLTEGEMQHKEFLSYMTEFLISEEVQHLFTLEEETTILNSIRTQVVQSGVNYTKENGWEFFIK